jgi:hypothetical protein
MKGIGLFCFDFAGSGISEGEYVTLGINESLDLECVVNHLVSSNKISNIALWGRRYDYDLQLTLSPPILIIAFSFLYLSFQFN